ncbi:MAG: hypothetical protein ACK50P_08795 [Planctomycetaceae bacterium]
MFEQYATLAFVVGLILIAVGLLWLIIRAFRQRPLLGLGSVLFPPALIPFAYRHRQSLKIPLRVLLLGSVLAGGALAAGRWHGRYPPLGEREKMVDGERHLTLTGWDRKDYALLQDKTDTAVLQMANLDVNDEVVKVLKDFSRLRELDLNGSQLTDEGLARVAALPKLEILRIRATRVTDEGFQKYLFDKPTLHQLDARETVISAKSLRDWKNLDQERRKYLK